MFAEGNDEGKKKKQKKIQPYQTQRTKEKIFND